MSTKNKVKKLSITEKLTKALSIIRMQNQEAEDVQKFLHEKLSEINVMRQTIENQERVIEDLYLNSMMMSLDVKNVTAATQHWSDIALDQLTKSVEIGRRRAKNDPVFRIIRQINVRYAGKSHVIDLASTASECHIPDTVATLKRLVEVCTEQGYIVEENIARPQHMSLKEAKKLLDARFKKSGEK